VLIETFNNNKYHDRKTYGDNISINNNIFNSKKLQDQYDNESVLCSIEESLIEEPEKHMKELNKAIRSLLFHKIDMPSVSSNKTILKNLSIIYEKLTGLKNYEDTYMVKININIDS
jgi:hypothetical protein